MNARGTRTRQLVAALAIALVALGGVACSSDSDSGDQGSSADVTVPARADTGTTEADLKVAATNSTTASVAGDPASYNYLSASCRSKFTEGKWATNSKQIADAIAKVIPGFDDAEVGVVSVRNVTPVDAEVQVTLVGADGTPVIDDSSAAWNKWVVEDGQWVTTSCAEAKDFLGS